VSLDTVEAVESALGWDTIYDPIHSRVISPVSRAWSVGWGGYVLFDWDSFFAGYMAGLFNRDLAYADIIEVLNEATPAGFVPNYSGGRGVKSLDRSQPPVGSIVVLDTYRRFHERWFLAATFERLLRWNRWWGEHRDVDGYLVWGSDPSDPEYERQDGAVNTLQGAKYESGLDNSPMYDAATFDTRSHRMQMADVGLMALYVADCDALATIAGELGRDSEARELRARSVRYGTKLATLWSPSAHLFLNRDLRTGSASPRTSPTNFYPLLSRTAIPEEARQMVGEHLLNPGEFWGEWVVPSSPRNDPAFKDQNYWRGRIWGPMNFLVYLGLRNYDLPLARSELARKSEALLLKEWKARGHVHENYNAVTGEGDDVTSSDPLYHWGALLGAMEMLEGEAAPSR
jgi:neutral trehalase